MAVACIPLTPRCPSSVLNVNPNLNVIIDLRKLATNAPKYQSTYTYLILTPRADDMQKI
jgi:hypothetical protein